MLPTPATPDWSRRNDFSGAVRPAAAKWHSGLGEFVLMYDDVRGAPDPAAALYDFIESTYIAGATLGNWDRAALEI